MENGTFVNHLEINSDKLSKEQGKDQSKQLSFKVVRDQKRKPKGKTGRVEYTLDCERRLSNFKKEFNAKIMRKKSRKNHKKILKGKVSGADSVINTLTNIYTYNMQSIAQVQNVQKINAVSTGKVANEKSMMVWRPHGNK